MVGEGYRREDFSQREGGVPKALPSSVHLKTMGHCQGHLDITRTSPRLGEGLSDPWLCATRLHGSNHSLLGCNSCHHVPDSTLHI